MKTIKKMKKKLLIICCLTTMITMTIGCSKTNPLNPLGDCFDGRWAEQYTAELQIWVDAITTYNENPTEANCAEYKSAGKAYINALDEIYDCVPTADRAEIDQAINEAKADLDNESCNG